MCALCYNNNCNNDDDGNTTTHTTTNDNNIQQNYCSKAWAPRLRSIIGLWVTLFDKGRGSHCGADMGQSTRLVAVAILLHCWLQGGCLRYWTSTFHTAARSQRPWTHLSGERERRGGEGAGRYERGIKGMKETKNRQSEVEVAEKKVCFQTCFHSLIVSSKSFLALNSVSLHFVFEEGLFLVILALICTPTYTKSFRLNEEIKHCHMEKNHRRSGWAFLKKMIMIMKMMMMAAVVVVMMMIKRRKMKKTKNKNGKTWYWLGSRYDRFKAMNKNEENKNPMAIREKLKTHFDQNENLWTFCDPCPVMACM